jgi:hypothetical protein
MARGTAERLDWQPELDRLDGSYRRVLQETASTRAPAHPQPLAV